MRKKGYGKKSSKRPVPRVVPEAPRKRREPEIPMKRGNLR